MWDRHERERDKGGQTQRGQTEGWRKRRKLEGKKESGIEDERQRQMERNGGGLVEIW